MDNENEQTIHILQYVKNNSFGLFLLILAFLIIYFVDYINRLNTIIYSNPTSIPGLISTITPPHKFSKKRVKKH
jgi:predicted ABC-type exoprotein transport system permease subunit